MSQRKRGRPPIYPWRSLQVGDSFFAPARSSVYMGKLARELKIKVRCRAVVSSGVQGCRVWRIA